MREDEASLEFHVRGVVQGVGFRPFVHRLALRYSLRGWVRNAAGSVTIRAQGTLPALVAFREALTTQTPPLAHVHELEYTEIPPEDWPDFCVIPSALEGEGSLPISPDVALCPLCLGELRDPGSRRYRYPFITCTDCGPRYTVIRGMPYDRERTSMADFHQCSPCQSEYRDPADRRYHSETNSCQECGPRVWFEGASVPDGPGASGAGGIGTEEALSEAVELIRCGGILALRGLGGFHLAVDANDDDAVMRLRRRKGRGEKALAIMVAGVEEARSVGEVGEAEEKLLTAPQRPIVLLRKNPDSGLAPSLSLGLDTVGVMTPYTPIHHLLLDALETPLVMTSGNPSDEPIAVGNEEARQRLGGLADGFLLHDREIVTRCDDSVVRLVGGAPLFLRRARGYAPLPLSLPVPSPVPLLAVGPHQKNTFTLVSGDIAYPSQHVGELDSLEAMGHFRDALARYLDIFRFRPELVVRDLHPGYLSTRMAFELAEEWGCGVPMAVQHHHAHVAAVLAEHGETGPAVGVAYDGTGYGEDGRVWGGEVMVAELKAFRRVGHLRYAPLPGGEAAVRNPWRTALGYLSMEPERAGDFELAFHRVSHQEREVVGSQAQRGVNAPMASSMGRLFDAAAAVLGVRDRCGYEGQAAMELEAVAASGPSLPLPFPWMADASGMHIMDPLPLLSALGRARQEGEGVAGLARAFHDAVIRTTRGLVGEVCREACLDTVVLAGGVFQNAILLEGLASALEEDGFRVLIPRALSPNDGAVSYGQAAVAAARLSEGG